MRHGFDLETIECLGLALAKETWSQLSKNRRKSGKGLWRPFQADLGDKNPADRDNARVVRQAGTILWIKITAGLLPVFNVSKNLQRLHWLKLGNYERT